LPNITPIAIAKKIQSARNLSNHPRLLNAELLDALTCSSSSLIGDCFSVSEEAGDGCGSEETTSSEGRTLGIFGEEEKGRYQRI